MNWWRWLWESEWHGILLGRWVLALLLVVGGLALAGLLASLLSRFFYLSLGTTQKDITRRELHRLMRPAWLFAILLAVVYAAIHVVQFFHLPERWVDWIHRVFQALVLLALGLVGSRLLAVAQTILATRYQQANELYKLQLVHPLFTIARLLLFVLVGFLVLEVTLKVNVGPFFTTLGLGGLAVALAAQETLQHFIGALAIFADKPFQLGEIIRLENGTVGTIERIGLRSTLIRTTDGTLLVIPNKKLADSPLENLTRTPKRRLLYRIGLLYSTPEPVLRALKEDLETALSQLPFLTEAPAVFFTNFQDSALELTIVAFVNPFYNSPAPNVPNVFPLQDALCWTILTTVRRHVPETDFAFPTRTLHIASVPHAKNLLS
ncbi:MAG: hypothetical protein KatS3mg026_1023 [Bacteroidia bacterium]|nr:MAG: hypothetical protein KatS3mg026_1023 [Bacteroidia bacterium]